jgi:flavin-binding protein dodecin
MDNHTYRLVELVGSSETSIEHAIQTALTKAHETLRHIHWFQVIETRGHVTEGKVAHYQVTLKAGYTLEDGSVGN